MQIRGASIMVTGASRGIGKAVAYEAARRQASKIILVARSERDLLAVAEQVRMLGAHPVVVPADLSDTATLNESCRKIMEQQGPPDILIHNAGSGRWLYLEDTPEEEMHQMMRVPFLAAVEITRHFLPAMMKRGSGHILCVNSPASEIAWPGASAYVTARVALKGFAQALQADLHESGIGVTHFVAGKVSSHYFEANPGSEARIPRIAKWIPTLTPEATAVHILDSVQSGKSAAIFPFMLRVFYFLNRMLPGVVRWLVLKTGWVRRPG